MKKIIYHKYYFLNSKRVLLCGKTSGIRKLNWNQVTCKKCKSIFSIDDNETQKNFYKKHIKKITEQIEYAKYFGLEHRHRVHLLLKVIAVLESKLKAQDKNYKGSSEAWTIKEQDIPMPNQP